MSVCKICKNSDANKSFVAHEMMFGYRDKFEYIKCAKCGCLQINGIPDNLSKYYPQDYYSFQRQDSANQNWLKSFSRHQKTKYWLYGKNGVGFLLTKLVGKRKSPYFIDWFRKAKVRLESEILDVGCGAGSLLLDISRYGFSHLTGIDPFIRKDILYKGSKIKIFKKELSELEQRFDFIILCDSFEHMSQPLLSLKKLYRLLKHDRYLLIHIPLAASFAWRKYGIHWVALDAPRHLFLHSTKSMEILAEEAGFSITDIVFDSTEFQFWGSEQYLKDIPLRDAKSYAVNPEWSIFSKEQINNFKLKASELNNNNDGDEACFYLYKK